MSSTSSRARLTVRIALAFAGAVALFLILLNLFLNTGLPRFLDRGATLKISYDSAWTFWPTVVHVRGVRIRAQNRQVQLVVGLGSARVEVAVRDLFKRTFHATRVQGDGVFFKLRPRLDPESATAHRVAAMPQIDGFPELPLVEIGTPAPIESPMEEANYWTARIENVDVQVNELWVDAYRFRGEATAGGSFTLNPVRLLTVNGQVELESGSLDLGKARLVDGLVGLITCIIDPVKPLEPEGLDILRYISSRIELDGALRSIAGFEYYAPSVQLTAGAGPIRVRLDAVRGVLRPGSEITLAPRNGWTVTSKDVVFKAGALKLAARGFDLVDPAGEQSTRVELDGIELAHEDLTYRGEAKINATFRRSGGADVRLGPTDINVEDVSVEGPMKNEVHGWWGRVAIESAALSFGPFVLDAKVHARIRDLRLFAVPYAHKKHIPSWTTLLLSANRLQLRADFRVTPDGFKLKMLNGLPMGRRVAGR